MNFSVPTAIAGRSVTNRGIHLVPFGFHGHWCAEAYTRFYWTDLMRSMHTSWCVLITDGDSCLEEFDGKPVVRWLLEAGIIPIIRWQAAIDSPFTGIAVAERLVPIYAEFGAKPFYQIYNEPMDGREWNGKPNWNVFINRWTDAARQVSRAGCLPGFPDGPGFNFDEHHPFRDVPCEAWEDWGAWYGVHNYGKGRPRLYPYDDVTQHGTPLTESEYRAALDIFADDPAWYDLPLDIINAQRKAWAQPGLTAVQDDVCWNAWQKVDWYANEALGHSVPMAMTEGGWQVRDRAGGGEAIDVRWPLTTPEMVARKTLEMFQAESPLFCQCPWLLACSAMGGSGWEYDAWNGWAFMDEYGWEKPVIKMLQDNPPQGESARAKVREAAVLLQRASILLREV